MSSKTDEKFMKLAIAEARKGLEKGHFPFGACIVKDGNVLSCKHNEVQVTLDATAHAEICAIRDACKMLKTTDLSGCVIYATCEPCPMCFSACHWARISKIVYGASVADSKRFFDELIVYCKKLKQLGGSPIELIGGVMRDENLELFEQWVEKQ